MTFYYDLNKALTTHVTPGTEITHWWAQTVANQESAGISGLYAAARFGTAGGAQLRLKHNVGTVASGGTARTPAPKNFRLPAAQTAWKDDVSAITPGGTLVSRLTVGFSQNGGMGGWVAVEPDARFKMMPNAVNPVDFEITSLSITASVTFDGSVEFAEGG
jgi:hypothetical protein